MQVLEHLEHVRREGTGLADAAERAALDAAVPTCPGWQVRDLVRHQGDIHRWATAHLARGRSEPMSQEERDSCLLTWPDDDTSLLDWFREGHARLVQTLETTPDDAVAFAFLPAPNARAFWARRQAHETAIHRADAESVTGDITAYDAQLAADGIDEVVRGFASRSGDLTSQTPRTLLVRADDVDRRWLLAFAPDGVRVGESHDGPDCSITGSASDLYLFAWNRRGREGLDVTGDPTVLDIWPTSHQVRWSGPSRKR